MEQTPRSRPITSTFTFLAAVGGELLLLRGQLAAGLSALPGILLAEFIFCMLILVGAAFTVTPKGWRSKPVGYTALALYAAYLIFNLMHFSYFRTLYLSCIVTEHQSYGAALEAAKLVLVLIGIVAAIPVMPGPEGREYMRGLERAVRRQQLEWAREGARGAKSDLDKTAQHLKERLSPDELTALLAQLKDKHPAQQDCGVQADTIPASETAGEATPPERSILEDWKGCGCG